MGGWRSRVAGPRRWTSGEVTRRRRAPGGRRGPCALSSGGGSALGEELAAYRAAGELRGVQVGVEGGRVRADVVDQCAVQAGDGTGDGEDGAGYRGGDQRDDHRAVDAERGLVDVGQGGLDAQPGEGVADLGVVGPDERDRAPGRVADGGAAGHRNLLVAGEERLLAAPLEQAE